MMPFTQNQSGFIAGDLLKSLGERHEAEVERRKQDVGRMKAAEAFLKNLPDDVRGMATEDLMMMSGPDKLAHMVGVISAQKAKHDQAQTRSLLEALEAQKAQGKNAGRFPAFAQEMGQFNEPGQLPYDMPPEQFEQFALPEGQQQPGPRQFFQSASRTGFNPGAETDNLMRALAPHGGGNAMGPDMLKQLGFVPTGGQMNPNGTASLTFGPPTQQFSDRATPILTKEGQPTGKANYQGKPMDLSPPNSEGKTLTQSETGILAAFNQADQDLANLEKMFKGLGDDWGGPVSGRVKSTVGMGQNPNIAAIENAITAATPNLARGVFREVGVLTDEDIKRYKALLPTAYDTDKVRKVKMDQLRERITQGRKETMAVMRKAGRDLSGFDGSDADADAAKRVGDVRKAVESTNAPALLHPAQKAALANSIAAEHPDWSREQVLKELNTRLQR